MKVIRKGWEKWKSIAQKIGLFQSRLILTLFYFTFLLPFGIFFTIFKDELKLKNKGWQDFNDGHPDSRPFEKQY